MLVLYTRSSSLQNWSYCQLQYFLTYNLGISSVSNLKAELGTTVHKVLEVLAACKKYLQDNPNTEEIIINDDALGELKYSTWDFWEVTELSDKEVDAINATRIAKTTYKHECRIPYGATRFGVKVVEDIIKKAYDFYSIKSTSDWSKINFRDVTNWSWMPLEYENGNYDPRKRTIVAPEVNFDFKIEEDWAYYYYVNPYGDGQDIEGYYGLKGTIDLVTEIDKDTLEIIDWKGLPVTTEIPTPTGWTTMGDLKVGDEVFDEDGKITTIIGKSKKTIKKCYKIKFDDKTEAICDIDHLWKLNNGDVKNILDLKEKDKISIAKPLELSKIQLPIDPYVLGMWLGDGRNRSGEITSGDKFIFDEIEKRGYSLGKNSSTNKNCETRTVLNLTAELRKLNLLHDKHIPLSYLRASFEQRLDLLRGLLDSDGNVNSVRKQAIFTNCNKKLSDDVKELILSLGQRPNQANVISKGFGLTTKVYPISFRPININPFLLPRKADRIDDSWGVGKSNVRTITSIEYVGELETQCIAVDSEKHTFLCTKNMIPTHNTGQRLNWATGEVKTYEALCEDKQLMFYFYAAKKIFPQYKNVIFTIYFVRDGGPFTVSFDESHLAKMEKILQDHYFEVQSCTQPKMLSNTQNDFRCNKLCHYYKNSFPNSNVNMCREINNKINKIGIDKVIHQYKNKDADIGKYHSPGQ